MKKLLGILVLGLFLITPSQADDIREFQIEGMSIGDSALDFFSEEEIKENIVRYDESSGDRTYTTVEIFSNETSFNLNLYDGLVLIYKTKDNKFTLDSVTGTIFYVNNIEECYVKLDVVINNISELFVSIKPTKIKTVNLTLGKWTGSKLIFKSGDFVSVRCADYHKEKYKDHLRISIHKKEYMDWIKDKAYE